MLMIAISAPAGVPGQAKKKSKYSIAGRDTVAAC